MLLKTVVKRLNYYGKNDIFSAVRLCKNFTFMNIYY